MSRPKQKVLRSSAQGVRPAPGTRQTGELYVNYPDKQLGVIDVNQDPQDLIAVRFFSSLSVYVINDVVLNALDGVLYQCIENNGPGPFTATDWTTALDSFQARLGGYETSGLHTDFTGDLDTILVNSDFAVVDSGIANAPADFSGQGLMLTNMFSTTAFGVQVLTGMGGDAKNKVWMRQRESSVWGSWTKVTDPAAPIVPVGTVSMFAGETTPDKYLFCDGAAIDRIVYALLFDVIGEVYGSGNGTTTFELPDYRGQFLRARDAGAAIDPNAGDRTDRGDGTEGDAVGTKQEGQNKPHDHGRGTQEINGKLNAVGDKRGIYQSATGAFKLGTDNTGFVETGGSGSQESTVTLKASDGWTGRSTQEPDSNDTGDESRPTNINVNMLIYAGAS